ncbi:hypothetical protein CsSME_00043061 [Camellia sinensis var. sinensis]
MVKSAENNGSVVPPFLLKCYEMVDDQSTDSVISWSSLTGDSFVISDVTEFETELLPKYFKHKNFSSFIRQLNIYGFRKIDTDHWEFANDQFVKGQKQLLNNICRRKQSQVMAQRKSSQQKDKSVGACEKSSEHKDKSVEAHEEDKYVRLWKEVESLKTGKNALMQELIKLRQHQQTSQSKLVVLGEQLKGMEKNQQQMLSFIVMAMQSPGLLIKLLQPKENNWRMAESNMSVLKRVTDDHVTVPSDGTIVRYQPPMDQSPEPLRTPTLDLETSLESELSSDELRDFFMNIDFPSGLLDEKLLSSESHGPISLPYLSDDDSILEQLLLSSPLTENKEEDEHDNAELDSGMEIEEMERMNIRKVSEAFWYFYSHYGTTHNRKKHILTA